MLKEHAFDVLRDYQQDIATKIASSTNERDTVVMCCGSGKTITALAGIVAKIPDNAYLLVLVPSLALVQQVYESYSGFCPHASYLGVCSKTLIKEDAKLSDLTLPHSTDFNEIAGWLTKWQPLPELKILISTYQSSPLLIDVIANLPENMNNFIFDAAIFDEAHRTAGSVEKQYSTALLNENIPIKYRLFITATPKIVTTDKNDDELVISMDNKEIYGDVIADYSINKAQEENFLAPYRIAVIGVTHSEISDQGLAGNIASHVAQIVALSKAQKLYGCTTGIVFHNTIAASKKFVDVSKNYDLHAVHIDGSVKLKDREKAVIRVVDHKTSNPDEVSVISNSRCFTEGIDIPAVDMICFAEPRNSTIDIVQCVGRALRKSQDAHKTAIVILPIIIPDEVTENYEQVIDKNVFKNCWQVVKSMSLHDNNLAYEVENRKKSDTPKIDPIKDGNGGDTENGHAVKNIIDFQILIEVDEKYQREFYLKILRGNIISWEEKFEELAKIDKTYESMSG